MWLGLLVLLHSGAAFAHPDISQDFINEVFTDLGMPAETDPWQKYPLPQPASSLASAQKILPIIDPNGAVKQYLDENSNDWNLLYSENDIWKSFVMNKDSDSAQLMAHLATVKAEVKSNPTDQKLAGLKILLDPGHMGTPDWMPYEGKFVSVNGQTVSEAELNLWTAFLIAEQLEAMGAQVMLTHTALGTIDGTTLQTFNPNPYIYNALYQNVDDPWMDTHLRSSTDPQTVANSIKADQNWILDWNPNYRPNWYIFGQDLEARAQILQNDNPDLFFDLHYDADVSNALQSDTDDIKAYVPGAFMSDEAGSLQGRAFGLVHATSPNHFNESVKLATAIVASLHQTLGIQGYNAGPQPNIQVISPGVIARNLSLTRRAINPLVVYMESFHYDYTDEFNQLTVADSSSTYQGISFTYPHRLNAVAQGITQGIMAYLSQ